MTELSDEMLEALSILRSDERTKAFRDMSASNQALVERLDKKEADDAAWRKEWAEKNAQSAGSPAPNSDPGMGDPGTGTQGPGTDPQIPQPPVIEEPKPDDKPKKKSRWWGEIDDA